MSGLETWATRRDGASQGGYLQFAVTRSAAESGAPVPLVVTVWASKKVSRISRASLDVEAQAGVVAVDALEFSKLFYVEMFVPSVSMQNDSVLREIGMSPVVTDAKALFDAARNMSATQGLSAANKSTAIDVKIVCERMLRFNGQWYCTNTLQQVSDGLTKVQARQRLVEILRRGYHALKFDPTFTAGKKLTTEQRQQRENELHQAAEFKSNILCCDEVMLTSETCGSVSLRGMSMCDAGYSGTKLWYLEARRCRRCWLITDPPHWGNECGTEPRKKRRRRRRKPSSV